MADSGLTRAVQTAARDARGHDPMPLAPAPSLGEFVDILFMRTTLALSHLRVQWRVEITSGRSDVRLVARQGDRVVVASWPASRTPMIASRRMMVDEVDRYVREFRRELVGDADNDDTPAALG